MNSKTLITLNYFYSQDYLRVLYFQHLNVQEKVKTEVVLYRPTTVYHNGSLSIDKHKPAFPLYTLSTMALFNLCWQYESYEARQATNLMSRFWAQSG